MYVHSICGVVLFFCSFMYIKRIKINDWSSDLSVATAIYELILPDIIPSNICVQNCVIDILITGLLSPIKGQCQKEI